MEQTIRALVYALVVCVAVTAWALIQQEKAHDELETAKTDLLESMVEVERLESRINTCLDIKSRLRRGEMD